VFVILLDLFLFSLSANAFVLVIDPGHGGNDEGSKGKKGMEKNINLAVGKLVGQYIASEHPDVKIVYTRTQDVFIGLDERAEIANRAKANLFISIHANSVEDKKKYAYVEGAEVYTLGTARNAENFEVAKRENSVMFLEDNYEQKYEGFNPDLPESYVIFRLMQNAYTEQSNDFASMVQNELVKTANRGDRGVKQAGYLVLRKSTMPRILIELDFLSNPKAENYLLSQEGQKSLARSISNAFTEYKKEFDRKEKNSTGDNPVQKPSESLSDKKQLPAPADSLSRQPEPATPVAPETIYKIQILASSKQLPADSPELKGYKADYYVEGGYYKYTCGESASRKEINKLRKKIAADFKDAFIIAFENGVKVPINK